MRCFIGIPVDHHLALALLVERDRAVEQLRPARPRPVEARNFHLTLEFIGDLEASQVDTVARLLESLAARHGPFVQPLARARCFPGAGARLFALEGCPVAEWIRLRDSLARGLGTAGTPPSSERRGKPRPHLTLVRTALPCVPAPEWRTALEVPVRELVLFHSTAGEDGSEYRRLATAVLGRIPGPAADARRKQ